MRHFDLCIIGTGSGNSIIDDRFDHLTVALVEMGTFGGTCLNVGCIPSKMFVHPADLAASTVEATKLGVDLDLRGVRWREIRDRIFGRVDPMAANGRGYRQRSDNVTVYDARARFVGPRELDVGAADTITADRLVIAAGSRPVVPDLAGLSSVDFHTSDSVMRLPELPRSMIIIGGGYVSAEFAHIFSAFGTSVTVLSRSEVLLRREDADVAKRFTELLGRRVDVRLETSVELVESTPDGQVRVHVSGREGEQESLEAETLLIATGRAPNGDTLDLAHGEIEMDDDGLIVVDDYQRTTAEGVFALGDVCSEQQLKHVANKDARVVQHNLLHPDSMITSDRRFVPHAVFSMPQVASVGLTEADAEEQGIDYVVSLEDYGETAFGWAMEDTDHFVKIIADSKSKIIIGAHVIGPQASSLIQPLIQAMSFEQPAPEVARGQYWIHPAMTEVVENALIGLTD
ncbi:MAG TPA: mycothione reductase [Propionibacteriaceae bacterium]|nr:mycothione reductase [Propionibacteriaceae bacterium]